MHEEKHISRNLTMVKIGKPFIFAGIERHRKGRSGRWLEPEPIIVRSSYLTNNEKSDNIKKRIK